MSREELSKNIDLQEDNFPKTPNLEIDSKSVFGFTSNMKIFVTGIGTDVGKTIASAIITESLEADYWKPIQAGDADNSDSHKLERLLTNSKTKIHPNSYLLQTPASPHFAAEKEGITIELEKIKEPKTKNSLVIEGAGGVFVPLNEKDTVIIQRRSIRIKNNLNPFLNNSLNMSL